MAAAIKIRNADSKRLFDVKVDKKGKILDYLVKDRRGVILNISGEEVNKQISESLKKEEK